MANEITRSVQLQVNNAQLKNSFSSSGTFNQTNLVEHPDFLSIPTTAGGTLIPTGAVPSGQEGCVCFQNLDQNNYAQLGVKVSGTFYPMIRLPPGSNGNPGPPQQFDWEPTVQIYGLANSAAVKVKMLLEGS